MEAGVKDTAAYRIIRQVTDHTWGSESDLSDEDVVFICRTFWRNGGSWEALLSGDMASVGVLEKAIDELMAPRKMDEATGGAR